MKRRARDQTAEYEDVLDIHVDYSFEHCIVLFAVTIFSSFRGLILDLYNFHYINIL